MSPSIFQSFNLFSLIGLFLGITSTVLAGIIFLNSFKRFHRIVALFNIAVAVWGGGIFQIGIAKDYSSALLGWKIFLLGMIFIAVFFFHIVYEFCELKNFNFLIFIYVQSFLVLLFLIFFGHYVIGNLSFLFNQFFYIKASAAFSIFLVAWLLLIGVGLLKLYRYILVSKGLKQMQGKYLFSCMSLGFFGGAATALPAWDARLYPFTHFVVILSDAILTYAILKYRLLDVKIAITRASLFVVVYTLVLGVPIWVGFKMLGNGPWLFPVTLMAVFATGGPFIYLFIQKRAEDRLLAEQRKYQATLRQASAGMGRIRDLKKLLNLIVAILTRVVRIEHVCVYFFDKNTKVFRLSAFRRTSIGEDLTTEFFTDHPIISRFSTLDGPLAYEEVRQRVEQDKEKEWADTAVAMRELKAELIFPIFIRSKLMAIVVLGKKLNDRSYTDDDLVVFSILANQASLAIENAASYEEMKRTQEQLFKADKMATIGTMADGLSHQINNRLHAMGFIASDMLDTLKLRRPLFATPELKAVADEFEYSLSRVQENVTRGGDIVQGLMKYTRKGEEGFVACNIDDVVNTSYEMAQFKIRSADFKITKEYDSNTIPKVRGNFTQLQEVFFNLIDNAYDATAQRKAELKEEGYAASLKVSIKDVDGWAEIVFSDNGMGVKPVDKDKLFTPFFTTKATSKKGTGLGLYVIRKIIEDNHAGKVEMRSMYGQGTDMVLRLAVSRE